jgi:hypothetical protein
MPMIRNATCLPFTIFKNFGAKIREMVTVDWNLTNGLMGFKGVVSLVTIFYLIIFILLSMHKEDQYYETRSNCFTALHFVF